MQMYTEEYSAAITYARIICVFVEIECNPWTTSLIKNALKSTDKHYNPIDSVDICCYTEIAIESWAIIAFADLNVHRNGS